MVKLTTATEAVNRLLLAWDDSTAACRVALAFSRRRQPNGFIQFSPGADFPAPACVL